MRAFMALLFTVSLALPFDAATCANFGPISITVPQGFDGPIGGGSGSAKTAAWIRRHADAQGGTLLQVTTYDAGPDLRSIGWQARAQGAKKYLWNSSPGSRSSARISNWGRSNPYPWPACPQPE